MKEFNKIAVFKSRKIRRVIHNNEWWFSVVDVVGALTDSLDPKDYWYKMKIRVKNDEGSELSTNCRQLKLEAPDGKLRETDCANTETLLRIVQSIPSPKAEPFKRWLAKVGYERVEEINDPELAQKRARALYKIKGYPDDWIERRMRSIAIREELTDEWKKNNVKEDREYEILTAEIAKATFDVFPSQHKKLKGLKRENLRDHMTDLELLFSTLGEAATKEISKAEAPKGFLKNKKVAFRGGKIAGDARKSLEKQTNKKIVSSRNYLKRLS